MKTKKRATNLMLLQRGLEELTMEAPKAKEAVVASPSAAEIKLINKPKKARGVPKKALINTQRLLTG